MGGRRGVSGTACIFLCALALILSLVAIPVSAQLPTGTIIVVVKDTSGGAVAGATLKVTNVDTGAERTGTTDNDGSFRFPALGVGNYQVQSSHSGFKTATRKGLTLTVSAEAVVNMVLEVGATEQVVVVTEAAPQVNTTSGELGGLVDEHKMADLPLNGRNYIDLTLLVTGVAHSAEAGTIASRTTGTWFSSNGAPPRSNHIMLDGAILTNVQGATAGSIGGNTLGVDGILEYRVITDMFGAEYGGTMGSQVVMVSKSGTNAFHGDLFEYLRNDALDARNFFDTAAGSGGRRLPPYKRNNFGGAIGGPLQKDKTFFHVTYEGLRENLGLTYNDTVFKANCYDANKVLLGTNGSNGGVNTCAVDPQRNPTGAVFQPVMPLANLYPYPNNVDAQGVQDIFTFPAASISSENFGQVRLDHNFSLADSLFIRYTTDKFDSLTDGNFPLYKIPQGGWNNFLTLSEVHIFTPAVVNTARISFSRTPFFINKVVANTGGVNLTDPAHSFVNGLPTGGIIVFAAGFSSEMGPTGGNNQKSVQNIYTGSDDVYYTRGRHALKFGVLFNRYATGLNAGNQSYNSAAGEVMFGDYAGLLRGVYIAYDAIQVPPGRDVYFKYNTIGMYAQDDFRASSRLTFNIGLRYEFNTTPREMNGKEYRVLNVNTFDPTVGASQGPIMQNHSLKNFSPRLGFAYDPTGSGKTSIRGGFGLYFDVGNIGTALSQYPYSIQPLSSYYLINNFTGNPDVPFQIPVPFVFPASVPPSIHTVDYYSKQPHLLQYNLTVERQLPWDLALRVGYVGSRGINLFTVREQNPNVPLSVTNGVPYWGPDPTVLVRYNPKLLTATMITTNGDSWYNSLQVNVNKQFSHGLQAQLAYTWSKSLDTTEAQAYVYDCFQATGSAQGIQAYGGGLDKGPSCFDLPQNLRFNLLYRFPTIKSTNNFASKLVNGWWVGSIFSMQSGFPFTPYTQNLLSNNGVYAGDQGERPNIITAANLAGAQASADQACVQAGLQPRCVTMQIYNPNTVITGKLDQWFNPYMFTLAGPNQTTVCPDANPACSFGYYGNVARDSLRGPKLRDLDLSINKDTKLGFLGEAGALQFRAEIFNILNHPNFALPNNYIYSANQTSELPMIHPITATGGNKSRQIQLALKIVF